MKRVLILLLALLASCGGAFAQVSGGGGSIIAGSTPVLGSCTNGYFVYNNNGTVGCSASSSSLALPQALTGATSGGIPYFSNTTTMNTSALLAANAIVLGGGAGNPPATTTTGTGVVTAIGSAVNTNGGLLTASTAAIASNAIVTGAGSGSALTGTTPGAGVLTALGIAPGTTGSFTKQNGAITAGNCLQWSASGVQDAGAACGGGSSTLTVGTTATSGGAAGQIMFDDGTKLQESSGLVWDNTNKALSTLGGGTVTTSNPVINATQTWNAGGSTFSAIQLNVTRTAAAAGSRLLDLRQNGTIVANITPDSGGYLNVGAVSAQAGTHVADFNYSSGNALFGLGDNSGSNALVYFAAEQSNTRTAFYSRNSHPFGVVIGTNENLRVSSTNVTFFNTAVVGWSSTSQSTGTADTLLARAAPASLQQGGPDAASPVAQTTQVQSVVAGNANVAGVNWTLQGSLSNGSGTSGDIIVKTGAANAASGSQNAGVEIVRFKGSATTTANPGRILAAGQIESSGSQPTVAGAGGTCAAGTMVGGANAGTFTLSNTCAAGNTLTLTFLTAAATGWSCFATNRAVPASLVQETSTSSTTAVFTVAGSSGVNTNVIQYACTAY